MPKMYHSKNDMLAQGKRPKAFSLLEVVVALSILAAICSTVLVVMSRCIDAAIDNQMRAEAFELARENMERLLAADSVTLMAELGTSDKNPGIQWETMVETFNEPVSSNVWLQAVCSVSYTDASGEKQTIELTHWLTDLTKRDQKLIREQKEIERQYMEQFGADRESDAEYNLRYGDSFDEEIPEDLRKLLDESGISL
jgi:type II secretory pathway pseudopilin PulG